MQLNNYPRIKNEIFYSIKQSQVFYTPNLKVFRYILRNGTCICHVRIENIWSFSSLSHSFVLQRVKPKLRCAPDTHVFNRCSQISKENTPHSTPRNTKEKRIYVNYEIRNGRDRAEKRQLYLFDRPHIIIIYSLACYSQEKMLKHERPLEIRL